jgi:RluA family pseudouridine synthase
MRIIKTHLVPEGIESARFSDYANEVFTVIPSRNGIKKAIKRGDFLIDGVRGDTGTWIKPGQLITLNGQETDRPVYHMSIPVVYEDDHIAVVNKPAGITVSGNRFKTVENALLFNLKISEEEDALRRPGPVHRLDSPTSGLLLVAKTRQAQINLGNQFESRKIKKRYRAVVKGLIVNSGRIISDIDGRSSDTEFIPVTSMRSIKNEYVTLVDLFPGTGRTHQLRRHMTESGHPIIGDKIYGDPGDLFKGKGLFLAAVELTLEHPADGRLLSFKIGEPEKFGSFMEREERRWKRLFALQTPGRGASNIID